MQSPYPSSSLSEPLRPLRLRIPGLRAKPALCPSVILTPEICAGHEELRAEKAPSLIPDLGCGRSSRQANPWRKISSSANFSSSSMIREIFAGDEISNHLRERNYQPRICTDETRIFQEDIISNPDHDRRVFNGTSFTIPLYFLIRVSSRQIRGEKYLRLRISRLPP